jgi:hypothetical protein
MKLDLIFNASLKFLNLKNVSKASLQSLKIWKTRLKLEPKEPIKKDFNIKT